MNKDSFFKENANTDKPIQLYAATKKSNEVIAYAYSQLHDINVVALRFFTVYGPWGRPDMSLFRFVGNILNNKPIQIFNNGNHFRDFTYIDDCVAGISKCFNYCIKNKKKYSIFNIARNRSIKLKYFISVIEKKLQKVSKKKFLPLQKGDIIRTSASIKKLIKATGYKPKTKIEKGVSNFVDW